MKDNWISILFIAGGAFMGYGITHLLLPEKPKQEPAVIAVSCPGSEPMLLENWQMQDGRITTKVDNTFIVVPDNCWLFVMKGDKRKVASR